MLLVDENTDCLGNCSNYILADGSMDLMSKILIASGVKNPQEIRIPENISEQALYLAKSLVEEGRSVYVIDKNEDCTDTVNSLLIRDYDGVVIDGKLYLNESDGSPQC